MAAQHAILSPSAAHRWLVCTPSARFEEQIPEEVSVYAEEGTLAHELAALILSSRSGQLDGSFDNSLKDLKFRVDAFYESLGKPSEFDEMYKHCEDYASFVMDKGGEIFIEHSYDLSRFVPCSFGTADATNSVDKVIHVTDFKYGAGVRVIASGNKQLMLYAVGAVLNTGVEEFETAVLSIYQPRTGGVSSWEIPVKELLNWAETEVAPKALQAIGGEGDFIAGEHCQFCKARTRCKAFYDLFAALKNVQDSRELTDEQRRDVLLNGKSVASWITAVETDAINTIEKGGTVPGFKLVAGRGRRAFTDENVVVDALLGEGFESFQIYDPKLQSLTNIEKLVGKKRFTELFANTIVNVPGKPQLAPIEDDRPAIETLGAGVYD